MRANFLFHKHVRCKVCLSFFLVFVHLFGWFGFVFLFVSFVFVNKLICLSVAIFALRLDLSCYERERSSFSRHCLPWPLPSPCDGHCLQPSSQWGAASPRHWVKLFEGPHRLPFQSSGLSQQSNSFSRANFVESV